MCNIFPGSKPTFTWILYSLGFYGGDILTLGEVSCEFGVLAVFHRKELTFPKHQLCPLEKKKKGISSSVRHNHLNRQQRMAA